MIARLPDILFRVFLVVTVAAMVAAALVGWLDSEGSVVDDIMAPRAAMTTKPETTK